MSVDGRGYAGGSLAWTMHIGSRGRGGASGWTQFPDGIVTKIEKYTWCRMFAAAAAAALCVQDDPLCVHSMQDDPLYVQDDPLCVQDDLTRCVCKMTRCVCKMTSPVVCAR